jgi:Na+/H+ antiporter NhaD/arsenite permease-like protein
VFKPFIAHLSDPVRSRLALALATTRAGNLIILGSVVKLFVIQRARHEAPISFWEYLRVGAPLTLSTIVVGVVWL